MESWNGPGFHDTRRHRRDHRLNLLNECVPTSVIHSIWNWNQNQTGDWRTGELELEVALEKIRFAEIKLESLIFLGLTLYLRLKELGGGGPS